MSNPTQPYTLEAVKPYGPRATMPLPNTVVHVTGENDVGKTTFALSAGAQPGRTLFVDADVKGNQVKAQVERSGQRFAGYWNLIALRKGKTELQYHDAIKAAIEQLPDGELDLIVWDTWTDFGASTRAYVQAHEQEFKSKWAPNGTIRNGEHAAEARKYEARLLNQLLGKATQVIVVTHLKDEYQGNVATGRKVADCTKAITEKSAMRVWLRHSDDGSPIPTGLILKRLVLNVWGPEGMEPVNVLPRKIPHLTWKVIRAYQAKPFGNEPPTADDMINEYERSILDGILTADQKESMRVSLQQLQVERAALAQVGQQTVDPAALLAGQSIATRIQALAEQGRSAADIATELGVPVLIVNLTLNRPAEVEAA